MFIRIHFSTTDLSCSFAMSTSMYHPPLCSPRTTATIRQPMRQNLSLARIACMEPIAFRKKVWCSKRTIRNPVPIRRSGLNYEYVNKLKEPLRRTTVFYKTTGQPGRKWSVVCKVALLSVRGASRVNLRTESALSNWLAMHHFDTWGLLRFL